MSLKPEHKEARANNQTEAKSAAKASRSDPNVEKSQFHHREGSRGARTQERPTEVVNTTLNHKRKGFTCSLTSGERIGCQDQEIRSQPKDVAE